MPPESYYQLTTIALIAFAAVAIHSKVRGWLRLSISKGLGYILIASSVLMVFSPAPEIQEASQFYMLMAVAQVLLKVFLALFITFAARTVIDELTSDLANDEWPDGDDPPEGKQDRGTTAGSS